MEILFGQIDALYRLSQLTFSSINMRKVVVCSASQQLMILGFGGDLERF